MVECGVVGEGWGVHLLRAVMEEGQATIQRRSSGLQRNLGGLWECGGTRRDLKSEAQKIVVPCQNHWSRSGYCYQCCPSMLPWR